MCLLREILRLDLVILVVINTILQITLLPLTKEKANSRNFSEKNQELRNIGNFS